MRAAICRKIAYYAARSKPRAPKSPSSATLALTLAQQLHPRYLTCPRTSSEGTNHRRFLPYVRLKS